MLKVEYIPKYTYQDYAQWEGDWELIHGYPYAMSPAPRIKHQSLGRRIISAIDRKLHCDDCEVFYYIDWKVDEDTTVRPDLLIACGENEDDFLKFPPVFIVEILSPSTIIKDKNIKFELYQSQGVKYYTMISPDNFQYEIFEFIDGKYILNAALKSFNLGNDCQLDLDFDTFKK